MLLKMEEREVVAYILIPFIHEFIHNSVRAWFKKFNCRMSFSAFQIWIYPLLELYIISTLCPKKISQINNNKI